MTDTLSDRVAALDGPSREVDDAIATALFTEKQWTCIEGLPPEQGGMWMFRYPDGAIGSSLRFTASLDAAASLYLELPDTIPSCPRKATVEALRQRNL